VWGLAFVARPLAVCFWFDPPFVFGFFFFPCPQPPQKQLFFFFFCAQSGFFFFLEGETNLRFISVFLGCVFFSPLEHECYRRIDPVPFQGVGRVKFSFPFPVRLGLFSATIDKDFFTPTSFFALPLLAAIRCFPPYPK